MKDPSGMRRGLTRYGDEDFALYLRKAFIKALGYSDDQCNAKIQRSELRFSTAL